MTFAGKLLVFLIMVMSVTFMAFSVMVYSTHQNWKDLVEGDDSGNLGLIAQQKQLQDQVRELDLEKEGLLSTAEQEARAFQNQIGQLETRLQDLTGQRSRLQEKIDELDQEKRQATAQSDSMRTELNERREEAKLLRKELLEVQRARSSHFDELVRLRDEVNMFRGELDRLKSRRDQLVNQVNKLQDVLAYLGETEHSIENRQAYGAPRVEGRILDLDPQEKLVEISLGSDDGILSGHQLEVYRMGNDPRYLGRIEIVRPYPDRAVAKVVPGTMKGPFERNDYVSTKLR
ncbi:Hypothetical protein PBC10988_29450 [Planctomycetales bacterium 10988]|nr:Hypothetical protein PBC10988_29450 [Planctomycetales bacterium 10988]